MKIIWCSLWLCTPSPSFGVMCCFICVSQRVTVTRHQMICLVLIFIYFFCFCQVLFENDKNIFTLILTYIQTCINLIFANISFSISTTWWVSPLMDNRSLRAHPATNNDRHRFFTFQLLNYFVWRRITDEGSASDMRIWSILLIKTDLKWCIHPSRSLLSYFNYLVSVTAGGPRSTREHM